MNKFQYYPCYPDGKLKAFTVSYDDGNTCDEPLVELLRKYHAKGTFNINSACFRGPEMPPPPPGKKWRRMTEEECLQVYGDDMEVAVHGAKHPFWDRMGSVGAMQDILDDKRGLERVFGRIIRGAAFPYGTFNDDVVEILRLAGFAYCRATAVTKKLRLREYDPLRFKGTVHSRDPETLELAKKFAEETSPTGQLSLFYVWGHTYEFMQDDNWDFIEEVLATVSDREDTWYCTNIELFDCLAAAERLQWNVDQTLVHNPTELDVWLRRSLKFRDPEPAYYKIPAGATVALPASE